MNYYEILGVGPDATVQQIKEGYRREAMKWHPDRHEGAAAKGEADRRFKDLALAYRTLRDSAERADYDRELEQNLRADYDARQQEQFRQESAQKDQAQRRQAKQDQPGKNYSEAKSQFEEHTATADDANQMFFEQMLDLAGELSERGFPEFNISKALIALGCPESLARAAASAAVKRGRGRQDEASSKVDDAEFARSSGNAEFIVKPKRHFAILGVLFGLLMIHKSINDWSPSKNVWELSFLFLIGLFGVLLLIHWGQITVANTLMIIDGQGIRFSRGGGRIKKWSEIRAFSFNDKKLTFNGITDGKKWEQQIPRMFVSGNWQEIVSRIDQFTKLGIRKPRA